MLNTIQINLMGAITNKENLGYQAWCCSDNHLNKNRHVQRAF